MSNNKGIPTIGVRGIQFRSRIEAQWAYIFEKLGWNWEYEPIDLEGYIPDFIIKFGDEDILIEIKGDTNIWKEEVYKHHKEKIIKSGWKGKFGILGSVYKISDDWRILLNYDLEKQFKARKCTINEFRWSYNKEFKYEEKYNTDKWDDNSRLLSFHNKKINIGKIFHGVWKKCYIENENIDDYDIDMKYDGKYIIDDLVIVYSQECKFFIDGLEFKDILDSSKYDRNDTFIVNICEYFSKIWVEAKNSVQWKGIQNISNSYNCIDATCVFETFHQGIVNDLYNYNFENLKSIQEIFTHPHISNIDGQRVRKYYEIVKKYYMNNKTLPTWKTFVCIDDIIPIQDTLHTNVFIIKANINGSIIHFDKFKSIIKDEYYDESHICITSPLDEGRY